MNNSATIFLLLLGILLVLLIVSPRGRDVLDVALGRKVAS